MGQKVKERALDTKSARARLKPRGRPYWRSLGPTLQLGYRKGATCAALGHQDPGRPQPLRA